MAKKESAAAKAEREWREGRKTYIGASEAAAILGCGYANQSPFTIWYSKQPEADDHFEPDGELLERMQIGSMMEITLRRIFKMKTGISVKNKRYHVVRCKSHPFIAATLDAWTRDGTPVELKNVGPQNAAEWEDAPPLKFQVQIQQQMLCAEASHGYLLGLIGGNKPIVHEVEANKDFQQALIAKLTEFWGYVQSRTPPPLDMGAKQIVARMFPIQTPGKAILLGAEASEAAKLLEKLQREANEASAAVEMHKARIMLEMQDAQYAITQDGQSFYSWTVQNSRGYSVPPKSARVFRKLASLPKHIELIEPPDQAEQEVITHEPAQHITHDVQDGDRPTVVLGEAG